MDEIDPIDDLVIDGIKFLRSMIEYYGQEKGIEVWNSMGQAMGTEVQGKILFAMLTGAVSGKVKFHCGPDVTSGVEVIKCLRTYTGMGLKQAKDLWDDSRVRTASVEVNPDNHRDFVIALRTLGVTAS